MLCAVTEIRSACQSTVVVACRLHRCHARDELPACLVRFCGYCLGFFNHTTVVVGCIPVLRGADMEELVGQCTVCSV